MNPLLRLLLETYKLAVKSGLMNTRPGRVLFLFAYRIYKRIEHRHIDVLIPLVTPGTWVVDLGANVGFLTCRFATWVSDGGKVIAIEPEAVNFDELCRVIQQGGFGDRALLIQALAADQPGELRLELDAYHPANHRIGDKGIPMKAVTLDSLTIDQNRPPVSLIKVDVQGADLMALKGGARLLQRDHPALVVEVDDKLLREFGGSARELLEYVTGFGYQIYQIEAAGFSAPLTIDQALQLVQDSDYQDFVFRHADASVQPR